MPQCEWLETQHFDLRPEPQEEWSRLRVLTKRAFEVINLSCVMAMLTPKNLRPVSMTMSWHMTIPSTCLWTEALNCRWVKQGLLPIHQSYFQIPTLPTDTEQEFVRQLYPGAQHWIFFLTKCKTKASGASNRMVGIFLMGFILLDKMGPLASRRSGVNLLEWGWSLVGPMCSFE